VAVPEVTRRRFPGFAGALERYGAQLYCIAHVPAEDDRKDLARTVVQTFFDTYAYERGWSVLKESQQDAQSLADALRADLFPAVTPDTVNDLLRRRRFVVLQGPPGTGKTRLAELEPSGSTSDRAG
jgi:5-methylcytosine-specific restriction protein B